MIIRGRERVSTLVSTWLPALQMRWLTGWSYRKQVTLSRASGALNDYQMKILIGESSGSSGDDVHCEGKCEDDFFDLRFTTADGSVLPHWIESVEGATPNQLATVWVKFDSIGATSTAFFMYYGNAAAADIGDGDEVFEFFDDFSGASLDGDKWTGDTGDVVVGSGIATLTGDAAGNVVYGPAQSGDIALRIKANLQGADHSQIGLSDSPHNNNYIALFYSSSRANNSAHSSNKAGSFADFATTALGFGSYHIYDITRCLTGTDTLRSFIDNVQAGSDTARVPTVTLYPMLRAVNTVTVAVDWVLVRKFQETEPSWGAWGSEESP